MYNHSAFKMNLLLELCFHKKYKIQTIFLQNSY